ncbi:MAG TPA: coenzyme F420-0:L-glutamate ligase [Solirubrobacterales bacterium]|jgi:coenzyme F420-0:L-glutamate ligase/coenzyme F420-1:gamma-L-glutamate ligase|nr:coenzyme F420-0:L-glutamate ligase [Solirubrobacterales bacterium]
MSRELRLLPVEGLPEVEEGMKLGELIAAQAELEAGDIVVISQKIVSKAEGRVRRLAEVEPSERAHELAKELGKEAELVELVLSESREVLRAERGVLITATHHGFVCANAGIDASNLPDERTVCLLPLDPDASARAIRAELAPASEGSGVGVAGPSPLLPADPHSGPLPPAVLITDSFGRAWRLGQAEVAIGCAGLTPLDDWRGRTDANGRELTATAIAIADEVAAAADLVRVKDSGIPAAIVRGLQPYVMAEDGPGAAALRRPAEEDLFR